MQCVGGSLRGGSTSCPVFMLDMVHGAHTEAVQLHEIRTGDLFTSSGERLCACLP